MESIKLNLPGNLFGNKLYIISAESYKSTLHIDMIPKLNKTECREWGYAIENVVEEVSQRYANCPNGKETLYSMMADLYCKLEYACQTEECLIRLGAYLE
jgi:hypothetical protein